MRDAIKAAITDPTYQHGTPAYNGNFVSLDEMNVERGADGGPTTSIVF